MTPEDAYEEALRRIRKAEKTRAVKLNLRELPLHRLPRELGRLTWLQSIDLYMCWLLRGGLSPLASLTHLKSLCLHLCGNLSGDLSPLAGLTSLQSLNLGSCHQLSGDLSPLAGLTSLRSLDLSFCHRLSGDLSPLAGLTSLQSLNLSQQPTAITFWSEFSLYSSDLSPLAGLTSLQSLDLSGCVYLNGDLRPLAGLTSLQSLDLDECIEFRKFAPLEPLLPQLQELHLYNCRFDDLPFEICGQESKQNVIGEVRAHFTDLISGQRIDAEVKVLFLGNGGVGKTQLCRRLCDLEFDLSVPTTHGIQLGEITLELECFQEPVRLNLWDFGGQDIYHGSHALFLHGQTIFLLLWTPELERKSTYQEGELFFRHRPLSYWLDYIRAFAGTNASVLIVQSQCDTRDKRLPHPPATVDDFNSSRLAAVSAKTDLGLNLLKATIQEAVGDCFHRRPPLPIGVGRVAVRDRLRQMLKEDQQREPAHRQHRLLKRAEFDRLCTETGRVNDSGALLDFLHRNGVVFYRPGLFGDRIILDQNWALEAIYVLFDRKKILPLLRGYGRFSQADLERLIWSDYTVQEQRIFLGMMESCGICFRVRELPNGEWEYIAPELLPKWSDAQEQLLGRLRDDPPDAEATAKYAFLHEGVLRGYLSKLGEHAKDAAIYWKYGCWFYERKTCSQTLIESIWDDSASEAGAGEIRLRAWGERADNLIEQLLGTLQTLPVGQPPEIKLIHNAKIAINAVASISSHATVAPDTGRLDGLEIPVRHELPPKGTPEIFVSYAWGDDSSEDSRNRAEAVDRLCETLGQHSWNILRDSNVLRSGELILGFMKRIGLADHVIVVLSDKYLRSPYCMTELHYIYQRSLGEKENFLRRIIPLRLNDARFDTWRDRVAYAEHWEAEFKAMEEKFRHLAESDFRLYKAMQEWHNRIGDMLAYVNDVLVPHGFEEIVKDDFAGLRQMLQQRRCETI
jgi:internalin A